MGTNTHTQPKLTLSKLPSFSKACRDHTQTQTQTPPLLPSVSIPFRWEEAPGKPRALTPPASSKSKVARCLDLQLPPRLLNEEAKITMMPSPTTVMDGPYVGRSLSLACTFSFRKGSVGPAAGKTSSNLGSGRWTGSFREESKYGIRNGRDSMDFSQSLGDIFKIEDIENNVKKMTRSSVKRRRSFFSTINSSKYLWADIYASFKQAVAVPWRRT